MRAIVVREFGPVENMLIERKFPIPKIGSGQLLVRVRASGVNPVDTYIRAGQYGLLPSLPFIPGREGAGIIEQIYEESANAKLEVGDRVWFGSSITGSYADFAVVQGSRVFALPRNVSFVQGASLGVAYATAYRALFTKAKVSLSLYNTTSPRPSVFIHGISEGVGLAACQLAISRGLKVYGTAGSPAGVSRVMGLKNGPLEVWDHREQDYVNKIKKKHPNGFDIVLEMLANRNLPTDLTQLTSPFGTVVIIGSRGSIGIDPRAIMQKELNVVGVALALADEQEYAEMASKLNEMLEKSEIEPHIGQEIPLEKVTEAHRTIVEGTAEGSVGKVVINMDL